MPFGNPKNRKNRAYLDMMVRTVVTRDMIERYDIRNAAIHYRQIEITHMIENLVYLELLRRGYIVDIGKNRDKEIDFVAKELNGRQYYIQVSYSLQNEETREREISAFHKLDDGYRKVLITMDRNPLSLLENGYQMMHLFDFLLNEQALEMI